MCGPVTSVVETVISIINILIFLVSSCMLTFGTLIQTNPGLTRSVLSKMLKTLEFSARLAGVSLDTSRFSAADLLVSFSAGLVTVGILLGSISVLGLIGIQYKLKPVLTVYFVIVLVMFLAQVVMFFIVVADLETLDNVIKPHLKNSITERFTGLEGTDAATLVWNAVMMQLRCCGVDDYNDFASATAWTKTINSVEYPLVTPIACCKTISESYTCAESPTDETSYWKTGCYHKWWHFVLTDSMIIYGLAGIILPFQVVVLVLTIKALRSGVL